MLTKVYGPSVVVCGTAQVVQPEDELLAASDGSIITGSDADHLVVGCGGGCWRNRGRMRPLTGRVPLPNQPYQRYPKTSPTSRQPLALAACHVVRLRTADRRARTPWP